MIIFRVLSVVIERKLLSSLHLWGILYSDNLSPPGHLPWLETAGNVLSHRQNFQLGWAANIWCSTTSALGKLAQKVLEALWKLMSVWLLYILRRNGKLIHEREKLKHTVTGQFGTQHCHCAESSRTLFAGVLWPHSAGLERPWPDRTYTTVPWPV